MTESEVQACSLRKPGPPDWEYTCHSCQHTFTMPAAKGPTEEKNRTCPECGSRDIERINIVQAEGCAPGG